MKKKPTLQLTAAQRAVLAAIGSFGGSRRLETMTTLERQKSAKAAGVASGAARRAKRDAKKLATPAK